MVETLNEVQKSRPGPAGGRSGNISHFTDERIAAKLMAMGVLPGSHMEVRRRAPFGGGWYVKVDNLLLALRQRELDSIVLKQE